MVTSVTDHFVRELLTFGGAALLLWYIHWFIANYP